MIIAGYRLNFDALLARLIYRWHRQTLLCLLLLAIGSGLASGLIPPFWHGRATLAVYAATGATILVDGEPWPCSAPACGLYAGQRRVTAELPDGRRSWADLTLRAGDVFTITLPAGLDPPHERLLPPAAPGMRIQSVWRADNAWRVVSMPQEISIEQSPDRNIPTPTPASGQMLSVGGRRTERLTTIDAYAGLADQLHLNGTLFEALYRPTEHSKGIIEIRGWGPALATLPISNPLMLVRFAPDGSALVIAEQTPAGGEQISIARPGYAREPVIAVPGKIQRLTWHPNGDAILIHSQSGQRLALTLARLRPTIAAATIAELDAGIYADALIPLAWDSSGLVWVMPETDQPILWAASLETLVPERRHRLDARAMTLLPDGTVRVLTITGGQILIGRYQDDLFISESVVRQVPVANDLVGLWEGDQLLLQGGDQAWLLEIR